MCVRVYEWEISPFRVPQKHSMSSSEKRNAVSSETYPYEEAVFIAIIVRCPPAICYFFVIAERNVRKGWRGVPLPPEIYRRRRRRRILRRLGAHACLCVILIVSSKLKLPFYRSILSSFDSLHYNLSIN